MNDVAILSNEVSGRRVSTVHHKDLVLTMDLELNLRLDSVLASELTGLELEVLGLLISEPGVVFYKEHMMQIIYPNEEFRPSIKILDVVICKIRKKLIKWDSRLHDFITTVWGRGYVAGEIPRGNDIVASIRVHHDKSSGIQIDTSTCELPFPNTCIRWSARRKASIVELVRTGKISLDQVIATYPDLTQAEFQRWVTQLNKGGVGALRTTYFK